MNARMRLQANAGCMTHTFTGCLGAALFHSDNKKPARVTPWRVFR